ncbi:hypothetical protein BH23ACT5_BH23ACT5_18360 [soil metagenome]
MLASSPCPLPWSWAACSSPPVGEPPAEPFPGGNEGWSQPGSFDVSIGQTPIVVTDDADLAVLWSGVGDGEPPDVDFASRIVTAVEIGYSGSCPETRLDDLAFDQAAVVFMIEHLGAQAACTDGYNPRTQVAIDRSLFPPPPFDLGSSDAPALALEVTDDARSRVSRRHLLGPLVRGRASAPTPLLTGELSSVRIEPWRS